jgi:hypothetical protein
VGPGFRYFAKADFIGTDSFTLVVDGKDRREKGSSTAQINVSNPKISIVASAVRHSDK